MSQPTPGTDKVSFMFVRLSWGQWMLVLRASFTRSECGWRRNEKKPYISRCCRVKEVLLVYNSFLDSFQHHCRDTPLASYLLHLLHNCLLSKKMDGSINSMVHKKKKKSLKRQLDNNNLVSSCYGRMCAFCRLLTYTILTSIRKSLDGQIRHILSCFCFVNSLTAINIHKKMMLKIYITDI